MPDRYLFSTPSPAFIVCRVFDEGHSDQCEVVSHCSFDLHFSNNEWCWAFSCVYYPSVCLWRNVCLGLFPTFWSGCLFLWHWSAWAACIFWKSSLCWLFHLLLFSPILRVVFSLCLQFLCCVKAFKFNQVPLVYFCFYFHYSRRWVIEDLAVIYVEECSAYVLSSKSFIVSGLKFRSLIHFEFIFVYGVRKCSNFILLHVAVQFYHLLKRLSLPHCIFLPPFQK